MLVVSDSHLSPRTPEAAENWDAVLRHAAATPPDLVIHAGDITADGADRDADLAVGRAALARLPGRVRAVPGNHDLGDNPHAGTGADTSGTGAESGISRRRLDRYRRALGPDRWSLDVPGWRIVGLNCLLFGSGLDDDADQWLWLDDLLPAGDRHVLLVLHKPLEAPPALPSDTTPHRYVPAPHRDRLLALMARVPGGLVVSGHTHQLALHARDGVGRVWAPSTWAVIPERFQPVLGDKTCGVVELTLHDDGHHDVVARQPDGLGQHVLIDTIPDPYSRH